MTGQLPRIEIVDGTMYELTIFGGDGRMYDALRDAEGEATTLPERRGSLLYKNLGSALPESATISPVPEDVTPAIQAVYEALPPADIGWSLARVE